MIISKNNMKFPFIPYVISKMIEMKATSLSDKEIERCLGNCIASTKLIACAKKNRDAGILTIDDINFQGR